MRPSRKATQAMATALAVACLADPGRATVVERVVAVVGDQAILLSDLRERARPYAARVEQQAADGAQRAAATSQLYSQLLGRMVDEELEQKAANRANVSVTAREIEEALTRVATQNGVTVTQVVEEAERSGLAEPAYRQELRRQLLEAKLLNLRIQGRLRVTEDDLRDAYQRLVLDERRQLGFRAAWIRLPAPRLLSAGQLRDRRRAAEAIVRAARSGRDFAALARAHSTDATTRDHGGSLGSLRPGQLAPALDAALVTLAAGEISEPLRQGEDFVVLKVLGRDASQLPSFEQSKDELGQRVYMEKMAQARKRWVDGLRHQTHVEFRL